jgi:ComF family protein
MLKFRNAPFAAEYFGNEMYECFKNRFPKVDIDLITIVPSTKKDLRHKHYDKVELLAKVFSKKSGVKLNKNVIKKIKQTKKQHDLLHNERQQNVKGAFMVSERLDGKTVLLVDDIKTTGYTLNECSKQLRMAGAEKVYCLTALLTSNKSCNTDKNTV